MRGENFALAFITGIIVGSSLYAGRERGGRGDVLAPAGIVPVCGERTLYDQCLSGL